MILLFFMVGIGVLLFLGFALVLIRVPAIDNNPTPSLTLPNFVKLPSLSFPSPELLFDNSDLKIFKHAPNLEAVRKQLLRDRKRLVLIWLSDLRTDTLTLWRFRRLLARCGVATTAFEEFTVGTTAVTLIAFATAIRGLVRMAGPFAVHRLLRTLSATLEGTRARYAALLRRLPLENQVEVEQRWLETAAP